MVVESKIDTSNNQTGSLIKKALVQAMIEKRLVVGLTNIAQFLAQDHVNIPIICLITPSKTDDYATHIHEVLLKAYCLENDIYIMNLDSLEKFNRILDSPRLESCALICANPAGDSDCEGSFLDEDFQMTKIEKKLVDFCEDHWDDMEHSTIRLPEK
ncbi:CLUMA_CG016532, isoform A [Clunio marinus]|uniref:CLUMA_CG016532, isoform A n=1 Tax=Clunio marinus TaxID=568069 RepID=A0A1J1ISL1_9DIPT|nr:CLUMA_CG016532, isoform A [Clunio marinus]